MSLAGRVVGWMLETERRHMPAPPRPERPIVCPRCQSPDVHGVRPCARRPDLDTELARRDHDWHCHACAWSAFVGDDDEG